MNKYEDTLQGNQQRYSVVDIFSTDGRIGRQDYFVHSIILPGALFLVLASVAGIIAKLGEVASLVSYALLAAAVISVLLLTVRLTIQRCHDFNANSLIALFAMIPFANIVFSLIPGDNGLNSYGEAPKPASISIKIATQILGVLAVCLIAYTVIQFFGAS